MSLDAVDVNNEVLGGFGQSGHLMARVQANLIVEIVSCR